MAQRKVTCKEAWKQDLIDHRALREQLHTIRTASLEQRHGSESEWKMRKMWHILRSWKPSQTQIYKNMMLLHWVWFERSFSNQTVQSISSEMAWADFSPKYLYTFIYFLRILQCTLKNYIQTHHQDVHICCQTAKQKTYNPREITWT